LPQSPLTQEEKIIFNNEIDFLTKRTRSVYKMAEERSETKMGMELRRCLYSVFQIMESLRFPKEEQK
jgi:hypothetical protein